MNIHEYQAKALLRSYGVPVSDGRVVLRAEEAKTAAGEMDGPLWVVKAQIHAGGRGKGHFKEPEAGEKGGVRLARSVSKRPRVGQADAGPHPGHRADRPGRQAGQPHLHRRRLRHRARTLPRPADRPRKLSRISFVVSTEGGMEHRRRRRTTPPKRSCPSRSIRPRAFQISTAAASPSRWGWKARRSSNASALVETLYKAFVEKDMEMLEINPLIVMTDGNLKLSGRQDGL